MAGSPTRDYPGAGRHWRAADEAAEKRAEFTGEETRCANCHAGFFSHVNGRCPK